MKRLAAFLLATITAFSLCINAFAEYENTHKNTGAVITDLISVAETQIGYSSPTGTSKYEEADNKPSSLDMAFVSWCAYNAKISDDVIPKTSSIDEFFSFMLMSSRVRDDITYVPSSGDIVFFGSEDSLTGCGIVKSCTVTEITVIKSENKKIAELKYDVKDENIFSYAKPDFAYEIDYQPGSYVTTASYLNFRASPSTASEVFYSIALGTPVEVTEISGEWGKITIRGQSGWINMGYTSPYDTTNPGSEPHDIDWLVIDVSRWQGDVDFKKVADAGIKAVILRIGLRLSVSRTIETDLNFLKYYKNASAEGLHIGGYFYSAATSVEDAVEEADYVINVMRNNKIYFDMPVYADMEENCTYRCGRTAVYNITNAFMTELENANIYAGTYCNVSWATDCYNDELFKNRSLWVADWTDNCSYQGEYGMWQFSSKGGVSGVESRYTDLNKCYINYPEIIKNGNYNIIPPDGNSEYMMGDIDNNKEITASDARSILRYSARLEEFNEKQIKAADADGNSEVTAADARIILRVSANLEAI